MPSSDAALWLEGAKTKQTGTMREFVSPPLTPGEDYVYEVRARWVDSAGEFVNQTRNVTVRAGQQVMIDFTKPQSTGKVTPVTASDR